MEVNHIKGCGVAILFCLFTITSAAQISYAEKLVNDQLEAYNKMDIDAFLKPFSDSVRIYDDLSKYNVSDKLAMQTNYDRWFQRVDSLNCKIINRIVAGNTIVDYEEVLFKLIDEDFQTLKAIAIYKISDNKIAEVYFLRPEY